MRFVLMCMPLLVTLAIRIKITLQGVSKQQVRWQKCVDFVNERLGMAVGRLFIRENFQKESKETVKLNCFSYDII